MFKTKLMFLVFLLSLFGVWPLYAEVQFPTMTTSDLEKAIADSDNSSSISYAEILQVSRSLGAEEATPILLKNLSSPHATLQHNLLSVLRLIKAPCYQVENSLIPFLNANNWLTKYEAIGYLGEMKCSNFSSKIKDIFQSDKDPRIKEGALSALVRFNSSSDTTYFSSIQDDLSFGKRIRLIALVGLLKNNSPIDENLITESLDDADPNTVNTALYVCSLTHDEARLPKIQDLKKQFQFSRWARQAEIGIKINSLNSKWSAINSLYETLKAEPTDVQSWIVNKLITDYDQEEKLKEMLNSSDVPPMEKSIIASELRDEMKISENQYSEILMKIMGSRYQ